MTFLPQLRSGAGVQFPIQRKIEYRTIRNVLEDGSEIRFSDHPANLISWELSYAGLTDEEVTDLQAFFESVQGRLQTFLFFDPCSNLLGWSEALDQPAWQRNTLLQLETSIDAPDGSQRASRLSNLSEGELTFAQEVPLPGAYASCFSFYARSDSALHLAVARISADAAANITALTSSKWRRYALTSKLDSPGNASLFRIQLPPETSLDIFGLQVEAQPFPSPYIPSFAKGAVYPHSRFDLDSISFTSTGLNQSTCTLRIVAPVA